MNSQFAAAMSRALEQTRAGNPAEATQIIQAALAGDTVQQCRVTPPAAAPHNRIAEIEGAEVVDVHPPRRPCRKSRASSR